MYINPATVTSSPSAPVLTGTGATPPILSTGQNLGVLDGLGALFTAGVQRGLAEIYPERYAAPAPSKVRDGAVDAELGTNQAVRAGGMQLKQVALYGGLALVAIVVLKKVL